jgi:ABC-type transport system involved in multi-copper enzyme maturation permease subunit
MLRLLTIEFHKLKYNKASKVLSIIYFALLTAIALIAAIRIPFFGKTIHLAEMGIFNFPYVWHFNTYVASFFKLFLLLVIVSMMANEYSYKTLKQNLIDGLSKKEFILSKFYTVIAFALISTIFVFIVSLILGFIYSSYNEFAIIISDLEYIFAFFLKLVGFFSFGLFLGILVKRSAFAVGAMLVWLIIEGLFRGLFLYIFRHSESTIVDVNSAMQFFPLEAMANLIKEPISRLNAVKSVANQFGGFTKSYDVEFSSIIIVLFWTAVFIYASYALLKKRDL